MCIRDSYRSGGAPAGGAPQSSGAAKAAPSNSWLTITCTEGKNRQIRRVCKHLGLDEGKENTDLIKTVSDAIAPGDTEEGPPPAGQIVISSEPSALNPGGEFLRATHTRALTCALLGAGAPDLKGGQFRQLKTLRIWRCAIGDDGAVCVAELMKLGGGAQPMALSFVSLMDNRIGPRGCAALGAALDLSLIHI